MESDVIDSGLYSEITKYLRYRRDCYNNYIQYIPNDDFDKIINARYAKVSRIKKRLLYLLTHRNYIYFLTFTFDDSYINKCDRSKKDLIKKSINSFSDDVLIILNRDFGGQKGREHYHAIIGSDNDSDMLKHLKKVYPFRSNVERVRINKVCLCKLSKYINKLSNHCVKDSTNKSRLYFNFKGFDDYGFMKEYAINLYSHTFPC